ncbi:MAG TPA: site-2 protease family protein [Solirubrobacteraceae bacterium]|nr:site-2 protease family protein [Solirubrobacteraceae bacterium]
MLRRRGSIKLLEVAGIRVGVDATWFVMLFLLIFLLSGSFRSALHSSDGVAYLTTVATVLLFFASLILHEFGHAVAARRQGIEVTRIELFLFGGLTEMSRDALTPGEDFKVAAAGPLATFLVVVLCVVVDLAIVGPHRLVHAVELDGTVRITPVLLSLSWLVPMNLLILLFNLVPAFPLDGGRIARAAVWRLTGSRLRGMLAAARLGQGFAALLGGVGIWLMLSYGSFSGLWLLAIAFMIGQAARSAALQTKVSERIEEVRVADVMDPQPVSIPAATAVTAALDEFLLRYRAPWLPVVDLGGHFLGIAHRDRAQTAQDAGEGWLTIDSVLEREDDQVLHVGEDRPLTDALTLESLGRLGAVMAVDHDGVLRGVITTEQIRRALQAVFASGLSG